MATQGGRSSFHLEPGGGRKEETLHEMRTLHDSNGGHFDSLCYVHSFRSRIREEVKELSKFSWCAAPMIRSYNRYRNCNLYFTSIENFTFSRIYIYIYVTLYFVF